MSTNSMFGLMDLIVTGCGFYLLYAYYLLVFKGELKEGILLPKDKNPKKCKDLAGYQKFMGWKTLLFALSAIASGAVGLYQDFVSPVPAMVYWMFYGLFFLFLIFFCIAEKQAEKKFW